MSFLYIFFNYKFQDKKIIHLDLKDENVLLKGIGDPRNVQVKLADFGLARQITSDKDCLEVQTTRGTLPYRSPEQILTGLVTTASDMWSLGCIISEMVTLEYFHQNLYYQSNEEPFKREEYDMKHVS